MRGIKQINSIQLENILKDFCTRNNKVFKEVTYDKKYNNICFHYGEEEKYIYSSKITYI